MDIQPPRVRAVLPTLVAKVDADGNEYSGIKSTLLSVPLGTYTGWNIKPAGFNKGGSCGYIGGFIPFAKTKAEREAAHDPRPSLEERYKDHDDYAARVKTAANGAVAGRTPLRADADRLIGKPKAQQCHEEGG